MPGRRSTYGSIPAVPIVMRTDHEPSQKEVLHMRPVDHTRFRDVDPEERKAAALPQRLRITKSNGLSGAAGQTLDVEVFERKEEE